MLDLTTVLAAAEQTSSDYRTSLISAASAVSVALGVQYLINRGKKNVDRTEIGRSGLEIVPEMGDKVLEALSRVQELTEAVGEARIAASEAQAEAQKARAEAAGIRLELAGARAEAQQLRAENAALRAENERLRTTLD